MGVVQPIDAIRSSKNIEPAKDKAHSGRNQNPDLLSSFRQLWDEAEAIWDRDEDRSAFFGYVSADFEAVYESLSKLGPEVQSVLEWGSGLGVVTIMASCLGFDACGIEAEQELVDLSEQLAEKFGPNARFAQGSFVPDEFQWTPANGDEAERTVIDLPDAYGKLDRDLDEFDLIYAYPWPTEHELLRNILREFGCPNVRLMTYDAREGIGMIRLNS